MTPAPLPLDDRLEFGFITSFDTAEAARSAAESAEKRGYDSLWVGDHVSFPLPTLDPLLLLAQVAAASTRLRLGTSVYLLPLRRRWVWYGNAVDEVPGVAPEVRVDGVR